MANQKEDEWNAEKRRFRINTGQHAKTMRIKEKIGAGFEKFFPGTEDISPEILGKRFNASAWANNSSNVRSFS
mgnify:CR=1 FL=1|tara:strand:- start:40 stop:258 length:219 start_codon:yes stop_codon:yes gene_type:complete